jgi:lysophospholipase L1-like esterase
MSLSRLIVGDSIIRDIRYIRDCEIMSLSGIRLEELAIRIRRIIPETQRPNTVLIHCGTNNIERDDPESIGLKIKEIIDEIKRPCSSTTVIVSAILPRPRDDELVRHKVKNVNVKLKANCPSWGAVFIATHRLMLKYGHPQSCYYRDGLHLNKEGTKRLRQFFSQRLAERGNKPTNDQTKTTYLRRSQWSSLF